MSIYQEQILEHYRNPSNRGRLAKKSNSVTVSNALCGDKITIDVLIEEAVIKDISFDGEGCVISQASCSMLLEEVKGKSVKEILKIDKDFLLELLGIELSPTRLKCALISLEGLKKAIAKN